MKKYKYIISILLVLNFNLNAKYEDKEPARTTKEDLELLKKFNTLSYNITKYKIDTCKQNKITSLIYKNRSTKYHYNKLKVDIRGRLSNREQTTTSEGDQTRNRELISLSAIYPIFDKKTDLQIKNKKIQHKLLVIDEVAKYCKAKDKKVLLKNKLDFLYLKQIRAKTREQVGQIYLDDRLKIIENILDAKSKYLEVQRELQTYRLKLLNKIEDSHKKDLEKLL